jgi:hypothetical protein
MLHGYLPTLGFFFEITVVVFTTTISKLFRLYVSVGGRRPQIICVDAILSPALLPMLATAVPLPHSIIGTQPAVIMLVFFPSSCIPPTGTSFCTMAMLIHSVIDATRLSGTSNALIPIIQRSISMVSAPFIASTTLALLTYTALAVLLVLSSVS